MLTLAVLIPVRNEAGFLERTLASLLAQTAPAQRLLVIDGGSTDGTADLARQAGIEVMLHPHGGRGGQIAAGLAHVHEEIVLIAHGDMIFPPTALARIRQHLSDQPTCPGGCLGHSFDSGKWRYRLIEWWDKRRARRGISYGDQAQFFRRSILNQIGGFPNQPLMEDLELSLRLRRLGPPAYLDLPVRVSPRRFETRGWLRVLWQNQRFRRTYRRHGVPACVELYKEYYG